MRCFCSAAQRGSDSPITWAALSALEILLNKTRREVFAEDGDADSGSLRSSMRQQLQQDGLLQALAAVMAAMAADLRRAAAALGSSGGSSGGGGSNAAAEDVVSLEIDRASGRPSPARQALLDVCKVHGYLAEYWGCQTQTPAANTTAWLGHPSNHVTAALQLSAAAMQHISGLLQFVLPALQQQDPQAAADLQEELGMRRSMASALGLSLLKGLSCEEASSGTDPCSVRVRQLLLSPHLVPCIALLWLRGANVARWAILDSSCNQETGASSGSTSNSSSRGDLHSSSTAGQPGEQQPGAAAGGAAVAAAGGSSSSGGRAPRQPSCSCCSCWNWRLTWWVGASCCPCRGLACQRHCLC